VHRKVQLTLQSQVVAKTDSSCVNQRREFDNWRAPEQNVSVKRTDFDEKAIQAVPQESNGRSSWGEMAGEACARLFVVDDPRRRAILAVDLFDEPNVWV
jgi:hypothetical protein